MSHIYTSRVQTDIFVADFGIDLDFEKEFTDADFVGKEDFLHFLTKEGYLIIGDDTKAPIPKGIVNYVLMSYPKDRFVFKDGNIYQSNTTTSATWVLSEWDLRVQGA